MDNILLEAGLIPQLVPPAIMHNLKRYIISYMVPTITPMAFRPLQDLTQLQAMYLEALTMSMDIQFKDLEDNSNKCIYSDID